MLGGGRSVSGNFMCLNRMKWSEKYEHMNHEVEYKVVNSSGAC